MSACAVVAGLVVFGPSAAEDKRTREDMDHDTRTAHAMPREYSAGLHTTGFRRQWGSESRR